MVLGVRIALSMQGKALLARASSIADEGEQKIYHVSVLKFGSGDLLCKLEDCGLQTVAELKLRAESKAGLDPELTVLLHAEYGELKDGVKFADLAGLPTAIDLYAQTLMKVAVAQHLGSAPMEVTNAAEHVDTAGRRNGERRVKRGILGDLRELRARCALP